MQISLILSLVLTSACRAWDGILLDSYYGGTQVMYPNTPNYTAFATDFHLPHNSLAAAVNVNGIVYFIGGANATWHAQAIVTKFDPITSTATTVQRLQTARYLHDATIVGDTIIVCGGWGSTALDSCEQSNINVTTWTYITPLPANLYGHALVTLNGSAYVIGGWSYNNGSTYTNVTSTVYMWNGVNTWTPKHVLPTDRTVHNAVALSNNTALVCGGYVGTQATSTCLIYTVSTDTWMSAASMSTNRTHLGLVVSEGVLNNCFFKIVEGDFSL
jgi:hypothetical protein